jgi:putative membrane protein
MSAAASQTYVLRKNKDHAAAMVGLSALTILYAGARVLQVFPGRVPMLAVVALHVLTVAFFALIHGAMFYRLRGILMFVALCLAVGNIFENLGVLTGFPFGHYHFTDVMGPKLFNVPVLLGLAYVGMGYLSWALGRLILGQLGRPLTRSQLLALPVLASFIMVAWDLSQDPVWSTILRAWIWRDGGPYFGVPLSNFLGWYLTVWIIFQLFALFARTHAINCERLSASYWRLAVIFYAISAAGNIFLVVPRPGPNTVSDAAGMQWRVSDITGTCALVSIFTMGAFALLAWIRVADQEIK